MEALLSLVGLLVFFAIGAFSMYLVIDFIEYLKKYHSERWSELSFANLFGISQKDLFFLSNSSPEVHTLYLQQR